MVEVENPQNQITLESVDILGVEVDCIDLDGLLQFIHKAGRQENPQTVFYVNAHCLNLAWEDSEYRRLLNGADVVYPDGVSLVWGSRFLGGCRLVKITGADWLDDFCEMAEREALRIYIIAGAPGIAQRAVENMRSRWPNLHAVGVQDGFFQEEDEPGILAEIRSARPEILIVGMGSPRQEKWIARVQAEVGVPVCWAVGALLDYAAGVETRVPVWMNRWGMEWLWRLLMDPFGKWKRYLIGNPLFVYRVVRQKLGF